MQISMEAADRRDPTHVMKMSIQVHVFITEKHQIYFRLPRHTAYCRQPRRLIATSYQTFITFTENLLQYFSIHPTCDNVLAHQTLTGRRQVHAQLTLIRQNLL